MQYILFVTCTYLLGSIPFGVIVAKAKGIDLMSVGSGNTGATNVTRVLGWKLGILVFLLDIAKGFVPVFLAGQLFEERDMAVLMSVPAVLGHTFSPFISFKGGKGIATSLGALFGAAPQVGATGFGVFLLLFSITRIVSLSSLIGSLAVLVSAIVFREKWPFFVVFTPLVTFVFFRHKENIQRLLKGEEPKLISRAKQVHINKE